MKNYLKIIILVLLSIASFDTIAQSSSGVNNWVFGNYLGWNAITTNPLDIRTANVVRMTLLGTNNNIGIGNTTPRSLLHLYDQGLNTAIYTQFTNVSTGNALATQGFRVGISNLGFGQIRQEGVTPFVANIPIQFMINPNVVGPATEREIMTAGPQQINQVAGVANTTRVGIWENGNSTAFAGTQYGVSLLHLGFHSFTPAVTPLWGPVGYRDWMDVGTYTNRYDGNLTINGDPRDDNTYVGMRDSLTWTNPITGLPVTTRYESVFNWGDNVPNSDTVDDRRLIFSYTKGPVAMAPPYKSQLYFGEEFLRMYSPDGSNGFIGMGGDPYNGVPYSMNGGMDPGNTVEISSSPRSNSPSGLRFTNLNCGSATVAPCANVVLSVNATGDVILIPGNITTTTVGFGPCSPGPLPPLTADAGIDMNNLSNIFFKGNGAGTAVNNVLIGKTCVNPPLAKLDVLQSSGTTVLAQPTIGINVLNTDISDMSFPVIGIKSEVPGIVNQPLAYGQIGGQFITSGDKYNIAVDALAEGAFGSGSTYNIGGKFHSLNGANNTSIVAIAEAGTYSNGANIGVDINAIGGVDSKAIYARAQNGSSFNTGVFTTAINSANCWNKGVYAIASDGKTQNEGVHGEAIGGGCFPAHTNFGGFFKGQNARNNYGVYATASTTCPTVGGGVSWAGYFVGNLHYTGTLSGPSDSIFKKNVDTIPNALGLIRQLKPRIYTYDTVTYDYMQFGTELQYGLIAQDLKAVIPSLVVNVHKPIDYDTLGSIISDSLNYCGINYNGLIAILIRANQQQQVMIDSTNAQMARIKASLDSTINVVNGCCGSSLPFPLRQHNPNDNGGNNNEKKIDNTNVHSIELSSASGSPILYQNIPNPFNNDGGTKIRYFVPDNMNSPMIVFFDEFGSRLQTFAITETGMGELDVTASNLVSGIYSYSLIINGKAVDTKKMVFQK